MSDRKIVDLLAEGHRRSKRTKRTAKRPDGDRGKALRKLISHVSQQARWTEVLRSVLPEDQAQHFSVANIRGQRMTIHASNASWATRLRFDAPKLLSKLHDLQDFSRISEIRIRALPNNVDEASVQRHEGVDPTRPGPPPEAPLLELADHTEYLELRQAILRLARHAKSEDSPD